MKGQSGQFDRQQALPSSPRNDPYAVTDSGVSTQALRCRAVVLSIHDRLAGPVSAREGGQPHDLLRRRATLARLPLRHAEMAFTSGAGP
jgi:hypothetical protein